VQRQLRTSSRQMAAIASAAGAAQYSSLTPSEDVAEQQPRSRAWRRSTFVFAASSGLAACGTALFMAKRHSVENGEATRLRVLSRPFRMYDSGAPGNLAMPTSATQYDGIEDKRWMEVVHNEWNEAHVFAVGDWGAPLQKGHITAGSTPGIDDHAQYSVANAMKGRAAWANPQYILNVGDNFYYGGIDMDCNAPPGSAWGKAKADFSSGWQGIYGELANKPWLSTLGNHDYGGWQFNMGWPQQIGYSFVNHNWVMPARYYSKKVQHPSFLAEYFFIDSNVYDALDPTIEPEHNICSQQHNPGGAQCTANGGMANMWACKDWFWGSYKAQKHWLEEKIAASKADWKIVVTHFPCGYDGSWYRGLYENHGLDLLVTGHRHQQELWWPGTTSQYVRDFMNKNDLGDLTCFVSGGGGGISAEKFANADYGRDLLWYGFFDLTISKDYMRIELIGLDGKIAGNTTIKPHRFRMPTTTTQAPTTTTEAPTTTTEAPTTTTEAPKRHHEDDHAHRKPESHSEPGQSHAKAAENDKDMDRKKHAAAAKAVAHAKSSHEQARETKNAEAKDNEDVKQASKTTDHKQVEKKGTQQTKEQDGKQVEEKKGSKQASNHQDDSTREDELVFKK